MLSVSHLLSFLSLVVSVLIFIQSFKSPKTDQYFYTIIIFIRYRTFCEVHRRNVTIMQLQFIATSEKVSLFIMAKRSVTSSYHGSKISGPRQCFSTEAAICIFERWKKSMGYFFVPECNHAQENNA